MEPVTANLFLEQQPDLSLRLTGNLQSERIMIDLESVQAYNRKQRPHYLDLMREIIAIPSVSTGPEHSGDLHQAAEWFARLLRQVGFSPVEVMPTAGAPVVYAEYLHAGPQAPTVLVYGHYDVQPEEPVDLWESDPFQATIRGENLFARGSTDMKGQILASIAALDALIHTQTLKTNIKFLIEGEEETGSTNLKAFLASHRDLLACDVALNPDTGMIAPNMPTITYALRGLVYFEVRLYGPSQDLHSGLYGGAVHNPAQVLCELIAGMHDKQGRVTLPGFYDRVRPIDAEERAELSRLPVGEADIMAQTGVSRLYGETGYTPIEQIGARPTLEVNGFLSGFTGEGQKTVLPSTAMAKISCRLVADQDPDEVFEQFKQFLAENTPDTVRYDVKKLSEGPPALSDRQSSYIQAMAQAMETVWHMRPIFRREGGSVPVVAYFQEYLGVQTINVGFALPEDNMHAPNEKIHLPTWERGIDTLIQFFLRLQAD